MLLFILKFVNLNLILDSPSMKKPSMSRTALLKLHLHNLGCSLSTSGRVGLRGRSRPVSFNVRLVHKPNPWGHSKSRRKIYSKGYDLQKRIHTQLSSNVRLKWPKS